MSYTTKQRNGEPKEVLGLNRITKKRILELCKKNKLYQTPELNDVLYLHYQGKWGHFMNYKSKKFFINYYTTS